jgi:two-component system phosphate regulon response regulator PhoB
VLSLESYFDVNSSAFGAPDRFEGASMARLVLIIEDNTDIAELLRHLLEQEHFNTRVALTGEEGLTASLDKDNPPAAILLDMLLPGMSGEEICRRLRREPSTRNTPIIMVSARASVADIERGLSVGADEYICKPFSIRQIVARVRALTSTP